MGWIDGLLNVALCPNVTLKLLLSDKSIVMLAEDVSVVMFPEVAETATVPPAVLDSIESTFKLLI